MGVCCSTGKEVNSHCLQFSANSDTEHDFAAAHDIPDQCKPHESPAAFIPAKANSCRSHEQKFSASVIHMRPGRIAAAVPEKQLLLGVLVHHDSRCKYVSDGDVADGSGIPQLNMKVNFEKMVSDIAQDHASSCYNKLIVSKSSCYSSQAAAAPEYIHARSDKSDSSLEPGDGGRGDNRSCSAENSASRNTLKDVEIIERKKNETTMVINSTADQNMNKATVLSTDHSSYHAASNITQGRKGEELSVFSAEKYFNEEENTLVNAMADEKSSTCSMNSSGSFCFQSMQGTSCILQAQDRSLRRATPSQIKSESTTDLEFPASTTSESDVWTSGIEDGDSLADFKKSTIIHKEVVTEQGARSNISTDKSDLRKMQEEDDHEPFVFLKECKFDHEEAGIKEKVKRGLQSSAEIQWHLAQLNPHEFVMSPSPFTSALKFSSTRIQSSSSPKTMDRNVCGRKPERSDNISGTDAGHEHTKARSADEFSFEPQSRTLYEIVPLAALHLQQAAAKAPAARDRQKLGLGSQPQCPEPAADIHECLNLCWGSSALIHPQKLQFENQNIPSAAVASLSNDHDSRLEIYQQTLWDKKLPSSLIRSCSDLSAKSHHSPVYNPLKKHGRNESDDYQSDMSTDLFEIDRLEAPPSGVSSPPSPKISFWDPIPPQAVH